MNVFANEIQFAETEQFRQFARILASAVSGSATGSGTGGEDDSPQLQAFLAAIPFANDGDVITADYHNSLRAALGQIGRTLDDTQFARTVTPSFQPVLLPIADGLSPWRSREGVAAGPPEGSDGEGWMPLDLPNGTNIDRLIVRARLSESVGAWTVALRRREPGGDTNLDLCTGDIKKRVEASRSNVIKAEVPAAAGGITTAQATERRRVNTEQYQYHFYTSFTGADEPDSMEIHLVQVVCTRG